jgi:hypothetical protein
MSGGPGAPVLGRLGRRTLRSDSEHKTGLTGTRSK